MDIKAAIMLLLTLLIGIALGALGVGALSRQRVEAVQQLRRPPGFVAHMTEVIAPRDSAQRGKIEPILAATAARNDSILHGTNVELRAALDSMRAQLAPMLDESQRERLDAAAKLAPPIRGGGDGGERAGGPPPEGAPPRRRGPPPPREGPGGRRAGGPPDGPPPGGPEGRRGPPPPDGRGPPPPDGRGPPPGRGPSLK